LQVTDQYVHRLAIENVVAGGPLVHSQHFESTLLEIPFQGPGSFILW
jgi:hypothetical protein